MKYNIIIYIIYMYMIHGIVHILLNLEHVSKASPEFVVSQETLQLAEEDPSEVALPLAA